MSYTSTYPKTFDRFLRFKNITENTPESAEETRLYGTFDIWIAGAFEAITAYCGQQIRAETGKVYTFSFGSDVITESTGNDYYLLPVLNVPITVSSVGYKRTVFDTVTTISSADYSLQTVNGQSRIYFQTWSGYDTGYITANVGYTDTNMPEWVQQVAVELVAEIYAESGLGDSRLGVSQKAESFQGISGTNAFYNLTERHKKMLKKYTLILP